MIDPLQVRCPISGHIWGWSAKEENERQPTCACGAVVTGPVRVSAYSSEPCWAWPEHAIPGAVKLSAMEAAIVEEREACAKVCDARETYEDEREFVNEAGVANICAKEIRARSKTKGAA